MKAAIVLGGWLCLFGGAAAHAQSNFDMGRMSSTLNVANGPSAENREWANSAAGEARVQALAACAAKKGGRAARELVEVEYVPGEDLSRLFDRAGCGFRPGELGAAGRYLHWAITEQLYMADTAVPAAKPGSGNATSDRALGACVAGRDPVAADAFVRSQRRSATEAAAFKRIVPAINACAGKNKLNLSGAELHGVLAEGLYRMRGTAAQGKN